MAEEADVYIGVFCKSLRVFLRLITRTISVYGDGIRSRRRTQIERLIFIMDKAHPITVDDVDIENGRN